MADDDFHELQENIFPKSVRKQLNHCIHRLKRQWEIAFNGSGKNKVHVSKEKVIIDLSVIKGSISIDGVSRNVQVVGKFLGPGTGGGLALEVFDATTTSPEGATLSQIGVNLGPVNGDYPSNFGGNSFLIFPAISTGFVYVEADTDSALNVTDVVVGQQASSPVGTGGDFKGYTLLAQYTFDGTAITILWIQPGARYYRNGNGSHDWWLG